MFVGGFFAKGFTHEITKGTVKVLFFGPISVTTMIFSKILYPLVVGPIFIFPVVFIGLSQFEQPTVDVLKITLVSYLMAAITMAAREQRAAPPARAPKPATRPATESRAQPARARPVQGAAASGQDSSSTVRTNIHGLMQPGHRRGR